jgi:hypothetical protein
MKDLCVLRRNLWSLTFSHVLYLSFISVHSHRLHVKVSLKWPLLWSWGDNHILRTQLEVTKCGDPFPVAVVGFRGSIYCSESLRKRPFGIFVGTILKKQCWWDAVSGSGSEYGAVRILWTRKWNLGAHKRLELSWLTERLDLLKIIHVPLY